MAVGAADGCCRDKISGWSIPSDFTNEMGKEHQPNGAKLPSMAIFPCAMTIS